MLPEAARLRLLDLGSSFVAALGEQRQPMTGPMTALAGDGGKWLRKMFHDRGQIRKFDGQEVDGRTLKVEPPPRAPRM
jgi:hypothetical protein